MHDYNRQHFQRMRWSIYAVLVLAYMSVYFHRMAPGVVSAELMATFQTTGAALGSLAAMYYYIYTAMQIPAGVLSDTLGIRSAVTVGNLIAGIGSIMFGMADSFEAASVGRFMVGLGVSVIFVSLMKSNTVWFSDRIYGLISGVTLLLGNLGSVLAAGPLAYLLGFVSWRSAFIGIGVFSLVLAVLSFFIVRNRPQDVGFPSLREMAGLAPHRERERHWLHDLWSVLQNRRVWPGFFVNFGMAGGLFAFAGLWGVPLLRDGFGLTRNEAANYTTVTLLAMAIGTLITGWLSDYIGYRKPVLLASATLYVVAWLLFLYTPWSSGWSAYLLFGLVGVTGSGFVLTYPCAKEVCAPALSGMAISLVNTGLFLGAALMQPLYGWVLDRHWDGTLHNGVRVFSWVDYRQASLWMLGFAVIALLATVTITETRGDSLAD